MPCLDSSGGLCWMGPRGRRLGFAASPPAEMFYEGGPKGGSGAAAQPGTAQRSSGKGGSGEKRARGETRSLFPPLHVPSPLTEHLARPRSGKGCWLPAASPGCLGGRRPRAHRDLVSECPPSSVPATGGLGKNTWWLFVPFPPLRRFPLFQLVHRLSRAGDPPGACLHSVRPSSPVLPL